MRKPVAVAVLLFAGSLAAQPLTVGRIPPSPIFTTTLGTLGSDAPMTHVNLSDPAAAAFTANRATVMWSSACPGNAFKVVFLRQANNLGAYSLRAQRGPFSAVEGRNDVTLSPAVSVAAGDVIGVVQLSPSIPCGSLYFQSTEFNTAGSRGEGVMLRTNSDMSVNAALGSIVLYTVGQVAAVAAYNADPLLTRILPVAGAAQGIGTFFRTSVQMTNLGLLPITGKLVFHRQGTTGGDGDPSLNFTVNVAQTLSFADVLASMGIPSGLGSLDVVTNGAMAPIVTARIFSDNGAAGTSGFTEASFPPRSALQTFTRGVLFIPADLTNFRMNVGLRTLEAGTKFDVHTYTAAGSIVGQRFGVTYGPNEFDQTTAAAFTGVASLPAGGMVLVIVQSGAVFIYGTVTDNRTQDSSLRMVSPE